MASLVNEFDAVIVLLSVTVEELLLVGVDVGVFVKEFIFDGEKEPDRENVLVRVNVKDVVVVSVSELVAVDFCVYVTENVLLKVRVMESDDALATEDEVEIVTDTEEDGVLVFVRLL